MKKFTLLTIALAAIFAANAESQSSANYQDGFFVVNEGRYGTDPGSINWFGADGTMQYNVETLASAGQHVAVWHNLWQSLLHYFEAGRAPGDFRCGNDEDAIFGV